MVDSHPRRGGNAILLFFVCPIDRSSLIESGSWSRDAVERQMSHMERNSVRAAYIHKAEFIDERKLMLQLWADFLEANRAKGITPFDYAKVNQGNCG